MATHATVLRLGTRGSALARWQAARVAALLQARGHRTEIVAIRTGGDEGGSPPPPTGKGLFTKEIEEALLAARIDVAVHSLKDLGLVLPDGLVAAAYPERADARDALVTRDGRGLERLAAGARVGTSSPRRRAALLAARHDLTIVPLRGNVPTRMAHVTEGRLDGAVLALAGLERLGAAAGAVPFTAAEMTPAPGQGALVVQCREDDPGTLAAVTPLDDPGVRAAVGAERAALATLEGGCRAPVGAWCRPVGGSLRLEVRVYAPDGTRVLHAEGPIDPARPDAGARAVVERLMSDGAGELVAAARREGGSDE